ncbi:MAG: proton-conducting transporter membrane subunit [bacterium]|nr:proton-conducting transporter membrane subunit [bacterium]
MNVLLFGLFVILLGGVLPQAFVRRPGAALRLHTLLLAAGSLCGLVGLFQAWQSGVTQALSIPWLGFSLLLSLDSLAGFFLLPVFLIAPLTALYGYQYLDTTQHSLRPVAGCFFFNLLICAMALVPLAADMIAFVVAWELMSFASFILVLYDWEEPQSRRAAHIYLLFSQSGAFAVFAAFGLLFAATGSFVFSATAFAALPQGVKLAAFVLALLGFGSKAGLMPLHIWLPHAHPAAPSHVSALMSGVMIKLGVYGILRMYFLLGDHSPIFAWIILVLGIVSGILGVAYALAKHDIKRFLAYHSIENIGIILIGCGLGMLGLATDEPIMAVLGFTGGLLHVLNHAIYKSLLFFCAGAVHRATATRTIDILGGLMRRMPITGRSFLTGSAAISGLPPLNGFVSEFLIYYAAFLGLRQDGFNLMLVVAAIIALAMIGGLATACFTKATGIVFLGEPRSAQASKATEAPPAMRATMLILSVLCLCIGFFPGPFIQAAFAALRDLGPMASSLSLLPGDLLTKISRNLTLIAWLFAALFLGLSALRRRAYRNKSVERGPTWGCGFTQGNSRIQYTGSSYAMSTVNFFRPLVLSRSQCTGLAQKLLPASAEYSSKAEDLAEVGLQHLLSRPVLWLAQKLRWIQHGRIQSYIAYIVLTIIVVLLLA